MAGNAKPVNEAMDALLTAVLYFKNAMPTMLQPPEPIDEELAESIDCDKLAAVIAELQQMDIEHCPGL